MPVPTNGGWVYVLPVGTGSTLTLSDWNVPYTAITTTHATTTAKYLVVPDAQAPNGWTYIVGNTSVTNNDALVQFYADAGLQMPAICRPRVQEYVPPEHHSATARDRATDLLMSKLTHEQRESFNAHGFFIVQGGLTGMRYRVRNDPSLIANIDVMDGAHPHYRLCAHPPKFDVPLGDHLLAQKLMLQFDEESFLRVANRY